MNREKYGIVVLWLIVVAFVGWAIVQTLSSLANYAPAIIAALATIYVALLNHFLAAERELRMQQQREKQKNYEKLLSVAAELVRDPENKDIWDTVHLYSWVVGSENVIRKTQAFTEQRNEKSLRSLLVEMRKDIGLEEPGDDLMPKVFQPKKVGHLEMSEKESNEPLISSSSGGQKRRFWPR